MTFQRGDVVLVPFPFSDLRTTKARPAVVISSPLYHAMEPDLILATMTSRTASAFDCGWKNGFCKKLKAKNKQNTVEREV